MDDGIVGKDYIHIEEGTLTINAQGDGLKSTNDEDTDVYSSPNLTLGSTYEIYYGGSSTGTVTDGLYEDGTYTPGTKYTDFTISGAITTVSGSGGHTNPFM